MAAVVLRLSGTLQSWGGYRVLASKDAVVPTAAVPRKSAINGLVGAAIGSRDLDRIGDLYRLHVRVERTNPAAEDYQVLSHLPPLAAAAAGRALRVGTASTRQFPTNRAGGSLKESVISRKDYLPHSEFIAALDTDPDTAAAWLAAFQRPRFMPYLGRKACPPAWPFLLGIWPGQVHDLFGVLPHVERAGDVPGAVRGYQVTGDYDLHDTTLHPAGYSPVVVPTREEQMEWVQQHLTR